MALPSQRLVRLSVLSGSLLLLPLAGPRSSWAAGGGPTVAPPAGPHSISLAIPAVTGTETPTTALSPMDSPAASAINCSITAASFAAEVQVVTLLNQHRAALNPPVPALHWNAALSAGARYHSCDMFQHQQLSHTGSKGDSPFLRMAYVGFPLPPYHQEGENVGEASGYSPAAAISALDSGMMAESLTPGDHHWNIVNAGYSLVGVGVVVANGQTWLTEDFAG